MKQKLGLSKVYQLLSFGPVVLISSRSGNKMNIMPISWVTPVDFDPPLIALIIGDQSYTFKVVKRSKELVINIPSRSLVRKVVACGDCSGKNTDKFKKFRFTPIPSKKVKAPGIKECIASIECKVVDSSMANKYNIFIVKGVNCTINSGAFGKCFRADKVKPLLYLGEGFFSTPSKIFKA
jgi:flavin reductase (DIM6/NTAB) family NADH-FMN oxidoreductase RutF